MPELKGPIHPVYLRAVEYLKEHPDEIQDAWNRPSEHIAGVLFGYAAPDREGYSPCSRPYCCGCLTQIRCQERSRELVAIDEEGYLDRPTTNAISSDTRIPKYEANIGPENLMVFAEWQQYLDELWNRKPPEDRTGKQEEEGEAC